jgi:hypothetical protein
MTNIIMNPTSDAAAEAQAEAEAKHLQRVRECQALFQECLNRYTKQRNEQQTGRTDAQIIEMALRTLIQNGFNRAEVFDALGGPKQ